MCVHTCVVLDNEEALFTVKLAPVAEGVTNATCDVIVVGASGIAQLYTCFEAHFMWCRPSNPSTVTVALFL